MSNTRKQDNKIPYLPPSVSREDLKNGRLIEQANIENIKSAISSIRNVKNGRYSAAQLNEYFKSLDIDLSVNFDFIKDSDQYYALYKPDLTPKPVTVDDHDLNMDADAEEEVEEIIEEEMENESGFGSVVLAQNIESLDWAAVKSVRESNENTEIYYESIEQVDPQTGEFIVVKEETHVDIAPHNQYIEIEKKGLDTAGQLLGHVRKISEEGKIEDEIIMKLAQGVELADFVIAREMPAIKWIDLGIAMMESANKLYQSGLLHRDYKPENFFYDAATGIVTPVDFGMARNYDHHLTVKSHVYEGTPDFSAPELSPYEEQDEYVYTEQTEIYALGATLAEIFGIKDIVVTEDEISYDASEFDNRIDNPIAREKLDNLISRALSWNAEERPTLKEAFIELKIIREQHLDLRSKIVKLAYLNLDDFKSLDHTHKSEIIAALRSADEVQLYAGKSKPNEWADIKHELENSGICVDDTVVLPGQDIMRALDANTTDREQSSNKIYNAFYITSPARKNQQSFGSVTVVIAHPEAREKSGDETRYYPNLIKASIDPVKLRPEHVEKVSKCISDQIMLLKSHDNHHTQLKNFERFLKEFNNSEPKTYKMLFDRMSKLEKEMKLYAKNPASPYGLFATVHKAVKSVRKEIELDVGIKKRSQ